MKTDRAKPGPFVILGELKTLLEISTALILDARQLMRRRYVLDLTIIPKKIIDMERIKNYFNNISKKLAIESDLAGGGIHRGDIGTNREVIFINFLNRHIPNRLKAQLGGEILALDGMHSGQLDIIISNDIGGRFEEKGVV